MPTNSLSKIIREATEHAQPAPGKEELITIDVRTGQSVNRPNFFETLTGDYRYFLVANNQDPDKVIKGIKRVKYKEDQEEIFFSISFAGGCRPGQEFWLAQCFYKSARSDTALSEALARWLIEYFSSGTATIDKFSVERTKAAVDLATKAEQEFGLDLTVTIQLEGSDKLETIDVGPLLVSSRLRDSEPVGIWLTAELEADDTNIPRFLLSRHQSLTELLTKGLRDYAAMNVALDTYYHELATERIITSLSTCLNTLLQSVGRRVRFLSLKPDQEPPPSFKGETVLEYIHHDYPDPIKIKISGLLVPTKPAHYRTKGSPKISDWLDHNLRETIDRVLFGLSYVDLLLDFSQYKLQIDASMSRRAAEIGYSIEQLMTVLYLEPFEWLKRIDVEIKGGPTDNGHLTEALFDTSLANFQVGLEVFLTARVRDLRGVAPYLTSKPDVPQRMKEEIRRLVRVFLHATDPERFYMRFEQPDEQKYPGERTVEEELKEKIEHLLDKEFNADVLDLVLKRMQTDLTRRLADISRIAHDFTTTAEPGSLPGVPAILVKGSFKVEGVSPDGWQAFRECDSDVQLVRKRIEASIQSRLKGVPNDQLAYDGQHHLTGLIEDALRAARALVKNEFGLVVNLTTISWEWEESLKQFGRQQGKLELTSVQARILKLKELLLELHENDASTEDIRNVEDRIRRLGATLHPAIAASVGLTQGSPRPLAASLPQHGNSEEEEN